jgi:hypothetical protein
VISQELRSIFIENMAKRNGNVTNAQRNMLSSRIGKLMSRLVALRNTNVIVEPSSPGLYFALITKIAIIYHFKIKKNENRNRKNSSEIHFKTVLKIFILYSYLSLSKFQETS